MALDEVFVATCLATGMALEPVPPKPGCVSRVRDFEDKKLSDFVTCSHLAVYPLTKAVRDGLEGVPRVGARIREVVELCILATGRNVCLGTAMLLAPIATGIGLAARAGKRVGVRELLSIARSAVYSCGVDDSIELYRAVRLAAPSYVRPSDRVEAPNVWSPRFEEELREGGWTLGRVLEEASSRDIVAREIVEGFPRVARAVEIIEGFEDACEGCRKAFIELLASNVDTVVSRKVGEDFAKYVSYLAKRVLEGAESEDTLDRVLLEKRVSPGSIADIVAAALSLALLKRVCRALQDRIKLCILS